MGLKSRQLSNGFPNATDRSRHRQTSLNLVITVVITIAPCLSCEWDASRLHDD